MQFSYQECYEKFYQSYGSFENWPFPYQYLNWFGSLSQEYQSYYLHPNNYGNFYEWTRQYNASLKKQNKKPSRGQKRKQKKKALLQEYNREKDSIGKWVQLERKDLITELNKIQAQEKKKKEKNQNKLSHLIEIHKEVFKHHMKRKSVAEAPNKRAQNKNKKKRMSIIKKMKQIFEKKKQNKGQSVIAKSQTQSSQHNQKLNEPKKQSEQNKLQQPIVNQQDQYEDVSQQQEKLEQKIKIINQDKKVSVSFPIVQIQYSNIGKLTGKNHNGIIMREWVTNVPNPELQQIALKLINRLAYKQAIKKVNSPQKAKKLIVSGLKQCKRTLTTILQNKKSKCLIVALNIERNNLIKGIDDQIQKCITLGQQNKLPVIHVSTRSKLGRAFTGKFGPRLAIISIVNFEGYQDYMDELLKAWQISCQQYKNLS